jgi:hypothetical protein
MHGFAVLKQYDSEPPFFRFWYFLPSADTTVSLQLFGIRIQNRAFDPFKLNSLAIWPCSRLIKIRRKLHGRQSSADCIEAPPLLGGFNDH